MHTQDTVIGIDLGTTNSEVAILRNGKVEILAVDGSPIVPSIVSLSSSGEILIGKPALNNELVNPEQTIRCIKRKMGQDHLVVLNGQSYTPQMISSLILKRLKLAAEAFLGHPVLKAVITVPAYFNEKQREATKEAAELAGLEPMRLLNEPTAAALAYSLDKMNEGNTLIYDLGGGTFDVSIVHFSNGILEVKASHGDTELGGSDFDSIIAKKIREEFLKKHALDLSMNPIAWSRLMRAAEAAKIRLSTEASAKITEEFIAVKDEVPLHLEFHITRTEFEEIIRSMAEQTIRSVRKALEMANLTEKNLDKIILVGGATYTPLIGQMLEEELKIVPQAWLDPSLVVARGAAIEAASLSGIEVGPVMVDITPHSVGTECLDMNGNLYNHILIRKNTPLPCTASRVFYKTYSHTEFIKLAVYQGESEDIAHNQLLGRFELHGLEGSGGNDVHIKYSLDRSGLLHVTATDIATGKKIDKTLKKVSKSRVQHKNLADLENIKIDTKNSNQASQLTDSDEFDAINAFNESPIPSEETTNLFTTAQDLLQSGTLELADYQELSEQILKAEQGEAGAVERLEELIFFMQ